MFRTLFWLCLNENKARSNCIYDPGQRFDAQVYGVFIRRDLTLQTLLRINRVQNREKL